MTEQLSLFDPFPAPSARVRQLLNSVRQNMLQRCFNPDAADFPAYGGRGIVVCDEWRVSSPSFIAWAIKAGYRPGLQLDRENNDGPYSPGNCRFVTRAVNQLNRSVTRRLADGSPLCLASLPPGVSLQTVYSRLKRGWSADDAVRRPFVPRVQRRRKHFLSDGRPLLDAARSLGVPRGRVLSRVARGWSPDDAVSVPKGGKRPAPAQKKPDGFAASAAELPPSGGVAPATSPDAEKHTVSTQGRQP